MKRLLSGLLISLIFLTAIVLTSFASPPDVTVSQLDPTARQQTIDAAVIQRLKATETAQAIQSMTVATAQSQGTQEAEATFVEAAILTAVQQSTQPTQDARAAERGLQRIMVENAASVAELRQLEDVDLIGNVAVSPDGNTLAVSTSRGVRLYDAQTLDIGTAGLMADTRGVYSIAYSPDGRLLAAANGDFSDTSIRLWDVITKSEQKTLAGSISFVGSIAFSPNGNLLASGSINGTVRLWDTELGTELSLVSGRDLIVSAVAFNPDGSLLASASSDGRTNTIRLWNVSTGTVRTVLTGDAESIYSIAFNPDGNILASSGVDGTRLWNVATGMERAILTGHTNTTNSVAFSPDGSLLATGSSDNTVRLWDVASESELAVLSHTGTVISVMFSSDGTLLVTGGEDGMVRLWGVKTGQQLQMNEPQATFPGAPIAVSDSAPEDVAKVWFEAAISGDIDTLEANTCSTGHATVEEIASSFDLAGGMEDVTFDYSGLTYSRNSRTGKNAIVTLDGSVKLSQAGVSVDVPITLDMPLIEEDGVWKLCGF